MEGFAPKTLGTWRCSRDPRGQPRCSPHPFPASTKPLEENCNRVPNNRGVTKRRLCGVNRPSLIYMNLPPGKGKAREAWLLYGVVDDKHPQLKRSVSCHHPARGGGTRKGPSPLGWMHGVFPRPHFQSLHG